MIIVNDATETEIALAAESVLILLPPRHHRHLLPAEAVTQVDLVSAPEVIVMIGEDVVGK
jgi:hypothetical protein